MHKAIYAFGFPLCQRAILFQATDKSNWVLKNVISAGKTRQNPTKKRSLCVINEHFEEDFNAVLSSAIVFQLPAKSFRND
jgi:hypothetical protein